MAHLIFQTAFPGDVFLSIPLIRRIRNWEPESRIVLACRPGLGDFFLQAGLVDEVVSIDKKNREGRELALNRLKSETWDIAFVPHESPRTALWMSRIKVHRAKVSFQKWWNFPVYSSRVVKPQHLPDALRQLSLLTPFDSRLAELFASEELQTLASPMSFQSPFDFRAQNIPEWASMKVLDHRPEGRKIFLEPGSVWNTKRWTARGYTDVAKSLLARGYQVELVGAANERAPCEEVCTLAPGVTNRAGQTTVSELVYLLSQGQALICNDSGAMHAAAVSGLPTIAIFGPTTLAQGLRPWNIQALVVQRDLKCRPCGKHGAKKCPIGTHECMEKISSSEVLRALDQFIH